MQRWPVSFWRRKRREAELDEELRSHLEMAAREREERGDAAKEAERAARREFGNIELVKEATRGAWGWRGWRTWWRTRDTDCECWGRIRDSLSLRFSRWRWASGPQPRYSAWFTAYW